jgi:hypothetical protein
VDLDTIPADTSITQPDSVVLRPVKLSAAVDYDGESLRFKGLGQTAKVCAFSYRNGTGYLAERDLWNVTPLVPTGALVIEDTPPHESACWWWVAVTEGEGITVELNNGWIP